VAIYSYPHLVDQKVLSGDHPDVYFWNLRTDDDDEDIRNIKLGSLGTLFFVVVGCSCIY
jgi:hypothetical protein